MRVGMTTFGGDGGQSGISRYIIELLRAFAQWPDLDIELITAADERDIFIPPASDITMIPVAHAFTSAAVNLLWHQLALPRLCRQQGYDVCFLPAANRRVSYALPIPSVGTVHDFSSLHIAGKYDLPHHLYITRVLPALVRRLTHVLTVSESSKRDIVEFARVPPERVTVTPLAADTQRYYPRDQGEALARVQQWYGVARPYLLYIARIEHPGKNHVRLIAAFDQLKSRLDLPHQLLFAGSDWNGAAAVHLAAERATAAADIRFLGFVPDAHLPDLLCGAEMLAFPSLFEGFGLPVLEAMCCGVPVASANCSSMPEVGGDAVLYFDPYAEDAIAECMAVLLTDETVREQCRTRGVARAGTYSWTRTAAQTVQVLREVSGQ